MIKVLLYNVLIVSPAGFEPALPKETDLKSVALDHSAIGAYQNVLWRFSEAPHTSFNKSGNCWKHSWNDIVPVKKLYCKSVHRAGFEPASPKREQLKCSALDHSAIDANQNTIGTVLTSYPGQSGWKTDKVQLLSVFLKWCWIIWLIQHLNRIRQGSLWRSPSSSYKK